MALIAVAATLCPDDAAALPVFNRQTGQNCQACHAGGQFPELTPYGRLFKLTGYTLGERQSVPLSAMAVVSDSKVSNIAGITAASNDAICVGLSVPRMLKLTSTCGVCDTRPWDGVFINAYVRYRTVSFAPMT